MNKKERLLDSILKGCKCGSCYYKNIICAHDVPENEICQDYEVEKPKKLIYIVERGKYYREEVSARRNFKFKNKAIKYIKNFYSDKTTYIKNQNLYLNDGHNVWFRLTEEVLI